MSVVQNSAQSNGCELITESTDVAVQGKALKIHMSDTQDGSSWRFVASTGLDTDEPVLDDIDTANAMLPAEGVQGNKDIDGVSVNLVILRHVDLHGETALELDCDLFGLSGGIFRRGSQLPHVDGRGGVGIFEDTGRIGDVEQVLISGPWLGSGLLDGDVLLSGELEEVLSASKTVVEFYQPRLVKIDPARDIVPFIPGMRQGAITLMSGLSP